MIEFSSCVLLISVYSVVINGHSVMSLLFECDILWQRSYIVYTSRVRISPNFLEWGQTAMLLYSSLPPLVFFLK